MVKEGFTGKLTLKQSQLFCRLVIVLQALGVGRPALAMDRALVE